jgi:hypothetical protein
MYNGFMKIARQKDLQAKLVTLERLLKIRQGC